MPWLRASRVRRVATCTVRTQAPSGGRRACWSHQTVVRNTSTVGSCQCAHVEKRTGWIGHIIDCSRAASRWASTLRGSSRMGVTSGAAAAQVEQTFASAGDCSWVHDTAFSWRERTARSCDVHSHGLRAAHAFDSAHGRRSANEPRVEDVMRIARRWSGPRCLVGLVTIAACRTWSATDPEW